MYAIRSYYDGDDEPEHARAALVALVGEDVPDRESKQHKLRNCQRNQKWQKIFDHIHCFAPFSETKRIFALFSLLQLARYYMTQRHEQAFF